MRRKLALLLLIALATTGLALAADLEKYEGSVQSVDYNSRVITLNGPQGWLRVWVQRVTEIQSRGNRLSFDQLKRGDQVTVTGIPLDDGRIVAATVRVRSGGGGSGGGSGGGGSVSLNPGPGTRITSTRPTISATFQDTITRARLWVDDSDFSNQLRIENGGTVAWTPNFSLDYGVHRVRMEAYNVFGNVYPAQWNFEIWNGGGGGGVVGVTNFAPGPGSVVTVLQPTVSAEFTGPVNRGSIRFYIDGRDFTPQVQISGNRVSWTPRYTLDYGQHSARLEAQASNGQRVTGNWNFVIAR